VKSLLFPCCYIACLCRTNIKAYLTVGKHSTTNCYDVKSWDGS